MVVGGKDTGTLDLKASVAARGQGRDLQLQEEVRAAVRGQLGKGFLAPSSRVELGSRKRHVWAASMPLDEFRASIYCGSLCWVW